MYMSQSIQMTDLVVRCCIIVDMFSLYTYFYLVAILETICLTHLIQYMLGHTKH